MYFPTYVSVYIQLILLLSDATFDRTNIKTIRNLRIGDEAVILGRIDSFGVKPTKKRRFFQLTITDATGSLNCVWFRGVSWIGDKFQVGDAIAIFGKVEFYNENIFRNLI